MTNYTTLFQQQSYIDALENYQDTLRNEELPVWDYVILTASNAAQAKAYELQIANRLEKNQLPQRTHYAVIPDRNGERIGSGGATFSAIKYVAEKENAQPGEGDSPFRNKRILCIHSGGDSKRVPQYSACGKLFSPIPRMLPDGRRSTLFDELVIGLSTVPSRITEGMLVCSGDVLLLFNALQIDFYGANAAALSVKESVFVGKDHGVYLKNESGLVGSFLHKQTVETLTKLGAVDANEYIDIDTGAVILDKDILDSLYGLVREEEGYLSFVNDRARISFYADFLYPMAANATLEQYYLEKPEGELTEELYACRTKIWDALHLYRMKLISLSPASFIHFGTTRELHQLVTEDIEKYRFLGWKRAVGANWEPDNCAVSNSYVSKFATIGENCYIEDSRIHDGCHLGGNCIVSGVTLRDDTVPENTVLHGLKLNDGRFVCRMYSVYDNPKENRHFDKELDQSLWTAPLFPVCASIEEAVKKTLAGNKAGELISLKDSFARADVTAILPWQENLQEQVLAESVLTMIDNGTPAAEVLAQLPQINSHTVDYLLNAAQDLDTCKLEQFKKKIRIYAYLSKLSADLKDKDRFAKMCLSTICDATLSAAAEGIIYRSDMAFCREEAVVRLPVRVNWGGGWSDTPPHCMEHGGTVLNAAVSLKGKLPVEVTVRKLNEAAIILTSTDIGSYKEFRDITQLQDCKNPSDPFALHKAALIACGVIPMKEYVSIEEIARHLGGGIYMNTRVTNIPKGSGLGTSSILSGACVKAISEAFGLNWTDDILFERALCMEQLMATGGGWQDQVGGLCPGIKMITTKPGIKQEFVCTPLRIDDKTMAELNERFCLIYTGQRRLARNLLREVITKYICNDPVSVEAHYTIQRLAVLMRSELEKGNVDGFAKLLSDHWEISQKIDKGCTNTCIDQIFLSIQDLIVGKMICGAGGGGFLQVVLKKGVNKETLRARLYEVFKDSGVDVWDCRFE